MSKPPVPSHETAPGFGAGRRAVVVTASTRAADGTYADRSGPVIVDRLVSWGFSVGHPVVVPDGDELGLALRDALASEPDLVLTTGGTGLTPTDATPEQTLPLLDRLVPGVAEAIRAAGVAKGVPTAMLSRGLAGVAGRTFVVNLPGSRGGVADALDVLEPVLGHALAQIPGSDHGGPGQGDRHGHHQSHRQGHHRGDHRGDHQSDHRGDQQGDHS